MLEIKNISKQYQGIKAVDDISFRLEKGRITGLLGPNGAGKTTTIRMIMDIIQADSGRILMDGHKINLPEMPGYLPEDRGLYQKTEVSETLRYFASLRGMDRQVIEKRIAYWLERFGLKGREQSRIGNLSKGNQQKVQMIITLMSDPDYLILDEPFTGLDPVNQQIVRDIMREFINKNKAIMLSTHQMEIAEKLCDHIILISKGRIVLNDKLKTVKKTFSNDIYEFKIDLDELPDPATTGLEDMGYENGILKGRIPEGTARKKILDQLGELGDVKAFRAYEAGLEDIFLQLTENGDA